MDDDTFAVNEYFTKWLDDGRVLVTTRHGSWCKLNRKEYELLQRNEFGSEGSLFDMFKEKGIIITDCNVKPIVRAITTMYREHDMLNFTYVVNLTNRCNLACEYCLADSRPDRNEPDMTIEHMHSLVRFINKSPSINIDIEFQGGESLLRFDLLKKFIEIVEHDLDKSKNLNHFTIVTNLSLLTREIADYLVEKNFRVGSSLDGPKVLHDSQRCFANGEGSYDKVVSWVKYLKRRGIHIGLSPTITKKSLDVGARAIIDEYMERGMEYILFRPLLSCGRGEGNDELSMEAAEFFEFWKDGIDYIIELAGRGVYVTEKKLQNMLRNIFTPHRSYMCMRRPCGAAISQMSFMPDGSIYACDSGKNIDALKIGNYVTDSYPDVLFNSLQLRTLSSEAQPLCDTCVYTAFCGTCISRAYSSWSDSVTRTPRDFDCKLYKLMFDYIFKKMDDPSYMKLFRRWVGYKGALRVENIVPDGD